MQEFSHLSIFPQIQASPTSAAMGRARWLAPLAVALGMAFVMPFCFSWMSQGAPQGAPQGGPRSKVSRQIQANDASEFAMDPNYLVKESSAMTKTAFRRRMALRKPLPERLALFFPAIEGREGQSQDARLMNFNMAGQSVEVALPMEGNQGSGILKLVEKHASLWRVQSSEVPQVPPGTLVQLYDATPNIQAPQSAETLGAVKSSLLQRSPAAAGGMAWNGMAGFSPSSCPRDFDGVHVAYTVWDCRGASGTCNMLQEGEDEGALVCEFGAMKRGLSTMIPGESRRFWISSEVKDRRFGRPPPERALPSGDVVVDLTLLGIEREAVFEYKLSDEAIKLGEM
eukprot:s3144_g15.t1